jgi:DNA-directed RNA polymerase subunit RPC12/RpoP
MSDENIVDYRCKSCGKEVEIMVTIYSHDEYFCDTECPECGAKIPESDQMDICNDEVTDWFSSKIDYAHDFYKDSLMER